MFYYIFQPPLTTLIPADIGQAEKRVKSSRTSRWVLFFLPGVTVLREGLEAVVFVGGVSLGQDGSSIPLAAIVGLIVGLIVGFLLYRTSSRLSGSTNGQQKIENQVADLTLHVNTDMSIFLVASTAFLLLIGAGLFSRSVGYFQTYKYIQLVGADVAETGDGPGSYSVHGNVWQ